MRKGLIAALVVIVLLAVGGYAGVQYGKKFIAERVMNEVVEQVLQDEEVRRLMDDPEVRQALREAVSAEDLERLRNEIGAKLGSGGSDSGSGNSAGDTGDGAGGKSGSGSPAADGESLVITSLEEAEALVLEKFSIGEIRRFAAMAGDGLTTEEKQKIQEEAMSRFTEEELQALKLIALMEAEKRLGE